jgi:AmmeMemoRadiSam system protein A
MSWLVDIATAVIGEALRTGRRHDEPLSLTGLPPSLTEPGASFVTLELGETLLGCIGTLVPERPLALDVAVHAVAAAFDDPRTPPLSRQQYRDMSVKVSVISPLEALPMAGRAELLAALRPGVDGLVVECGRRRATFLPAVWPKVLSPAHFVDALWQKAGLPYGAWPEGLVLSRYTTEEVVDPGPRAAIQERAGL